MTKQIGNPELLDTWAAQGDTSEPFLSKKEQGWLFQEQPASSIANWLVNAQQKKINHLLKNGVSEWSTNTDYTRGAIVKHANTAWRALRDNTASEPAAGNLDWAEVSTLPIIRAPDLISPINGASGVSTTGTLTASEYAPVYSVDTRDYREFQVDVSGGDFSSPVRTHQEDADTWAVDPALDASAGYEWRCRDVSDRGDVSEWSVIEPFTTGANFITTPSITAPADNATDITETPTFTSSAFAVTGTTDTHAASYWRVMQGSTVVWETGRTTTDLESATIPEGILQDGETEYTVQVRHEGADLGLSAWSTASTFTTLDTFTRVAQPSITSPLASETDIPETPTLTSSAFAVVNGSDTHAASFWEVYDNSDVLVWSSGRTTIYRTSIAMPAGILEDGETTYKLRVRHEGQSLGVSIWSNTVVFTTAESFSLVFVGNTLNTLKVSASNLNTLDSLSGSPDEGGIAFGSDGFLYSTRTGTPNLIVKINTSNMTDVDTFEPPSNLNDALIYAPDGYLYLGSGSDLLKIDPSDMTQADIFSGHSSGIQSLAAGSDGFIYSGGGPADTTVRKIDPSDMSQVGVFSGHAEAISGLAFGSDGYLYSGGGNSVRKIDPSDMSETLSLSGQVANVRAMVFGPDGFLYLSDTLSNDIIKVNPSTMAQASFTGGVGDVIHLSYGDDGYLYGGSTNGSVYKVDPSDMTILDTVSAGDSINGVAFNISIPDLLGFTA